MRDLPFIPRLPAWTFRTGDRFDADGFPRDDFRYYLSVEIHAVPKGFAWGTSWAVQSHADLNTAPDNHIVGMCQSIRVTDDVRPQFGLAVAAASAQILAAPWGLFSRIDVEDWLNALRRDPPPRHPQHLVASNAAAVFDVRERNCVDLRDIPLLHEACARVCAGDVSNERDFYMWQKWPDRRMRDFDAKDHADVAAAIAALRGFDVVCGCAFGDATCPADAILALANAQAGILPMRG